MLAGFGRRGHPLDAETAVACARLCASVRLHGFGGFGMARSLSAALGQSSRRIVVVNAK